MPIGSSTIFIKYYYTEKLIEIDIKKINALEIICYKNKTNISNAGRYSFLITFFQTKF